MKGIDFIVCRKESASFVIDFLRERFEFKVKQSYHELICSVRVDFSENLISINNRFERNFENVIVDGHNFSLDRQIVMSSIEKFSSSGRALFNHRFRTRDINYNFAIKSKCKTHLVDALQTKIMLNDFNKSIEKIKQNFKQMEISKTQVLKINGKKREVTLVVLTEQNKIKAGYSVRVPGDKKNEKLGKSIAKGRALKPKTNLIDMELGKGLDRKFILYAIADDLFKKIERGIIEIKGIK